MRILVLLCLLFPGLALAQSTSRPTLQQLAQPRGSSHEVPRFGGQTKTTEQMAADRQFVATALREDNTPRAAAHAYVNFGWRYLHSSSPVVAIKRFNRAWLLDSTLADVYYGFSACLQHQGQTAEAERFRQLGQGHDAGNQALIRYYGSLAYGQSLRRDYAGALATNARILALDANNAFANSRAGFWYMQQADTAQASRYLTRAVALAPQDSVSFLNRGWLRYGQKRYAAATADFTAAIQVNPHYLSAYANRALAYADAANYPAAIADYEQCLRLVPPRDKGQIYRAIGAAKLKLQDQTGACQAFQQALQWGDTPAMEKEIRRLQKSNCR